MMIATRICKTPVPTLEQGQNLQTVHVTHILIQLHPVEKNKVIVGRTVGCVIMWGGRVFGWEELIHGYGQCTLNSPVAALNEIKHLFPLPTVLCTPFNLNIVYEQVYEGMATRILVQCISHEMPHPNGKEKNDYMANLACQKKWGRDFDPAQDRLTTRGGYFLYNQPCWVIIDNGPTDAKSYTTAWFKWSSQERDL